MDTVEEFLLVLAHSRRTQVALVLGPTFFIAILVLGAYLVHDVQFQGMLAPLTDPIREALLGRYEEAAWGALGTFMVLAVKSYLKDRKRLLSF